MSKRCPLLARMIRLSDSDKNQIVELYRQTGETTLTLAERYGVSNTTISRILKNSLSPEEYDGLIQQKRYASRGSNRATVQNSEVLTAQATTIDAAPNTVEAEPVQGNLLEEPAAIEAPSEPEPPEEAQPEPITSQTSEIEAVSSPNAPIRRSRRRSSAPSEIDSDPSIASQTFSIEADLEPVADSTSEPAVVPTATVATMLDEELTSSTGDLSEDEDEDDLDDLDDLDGDLDDDDDDDEPAVLPSIQLNAAEFIRVLPIAEAAIPRTCYLVVDRSAELVARPLREFAELGQIPSEEIQEKTLPVFDNHRVAKRFSNIRTQRVIKVPDSRVLQKAAPYLQAKGITRLLIDGQVYAL